MAKLYQAGFLAKTKHLNKKIGQRRKMAFTKISNRIMIWVLVGG